MANNPTKQGMIKIIIVPNLEHLIIRKSKMPDKYVYRLQPSSGICRVYEIGECDNPRSYEGWCDRRVCEGFWGREEECRRLVKKMNQR